MPSMRYIVRSLAAFGATVPSITESFDLDDTYDMKPMPEKISRPMLPCLIVVPELVTETGYMNHAFMGNAPMDEFKVTHLLLYREAANIKIHQVLGRIIEMRDAYIATAAATKLLDGDDPAVKRYQTVMKFDVRLSAVDWGGTVYHALEFCHSFNLNL
jgi:hypothetical protein